MQRSNMKTINFHGDEGDWMQARRGKITGSKVSKVVSKRAYTINDIKEYLGDKAPSKGKKEVYEELLTDEDKITLSISGKRNIGFYEIIADRLGFPADENEPDMDRGNRLESEAIEEFVKQTGIKMETGKVMWYREDNESIAVTPDAWGKKVALEVKCQNPARHIKSLVENEPPEGYENQFLQYFVVNDELETLYVVSYNPLITVKPLLVFEIHRKDVQDEVDQMRATQNALLAEVDRIVNELTF